MTFYSMISCDSSCARSRYKMCFGRLRSCFNYHLSSTSALWEHELFFKCTKLTMWVGSDQFSYIYNFPGIYDDTAYYAHVVVDHVITIIHNFRFLNQSIINTIEFQRNDLRLDHKLRIMSAATRKHLELIRI